MLTASPISTAVSGFVPIEICPVVVRTSPTIAGRPKRCPNSDAAHSVTYFDRRFPRRAHRNPPLLAVRTSPTTAGRRTRSGTMENPQVDAAQTLLDAFHFYLIVNDDDHHAANRNATHAFSELRDVVMEQTLNDGPPLAIEQGTGYEYRYELMLVGLHTHPARGICIGYDGRCIFVVAKYLLHNFIF